MQWMCTNLPVVVTLLMGRICNVDFLEKEILGFDENFTVAL